MSFEEASRRTSVAVVIASSIIGRVADDREPAATVANT